MTKVFSAILFFSIAMPGYACIDKPCDGSCKISAHLSTQPLKLAEGKVEEEEKSEDSLSLFETCFALEIYFGIFRGFEPKDWAKLLILSKRMRSITIGTLELQPEWEECWAKGPPPSTLQNFIFNQRFFEIFGVVLRCLQSQAHAKESAFSWDTKSNNHAKVVSIMPGVLSLQKESPFHGNLLLAFAQFITGRKDPTSTKERTNNRPWQQTLQHEGLLKQILNHGKRTLNPTLERCMAWTLCEFGLAPGKSSAFLKSNTRRKKAPRMLIPQAYIQAQQIEKKIQDTDLDASSLFQAYQSLVTISPFPSLTTWLGWGDCNRYFAVHEKKSRPYWRRAAEAYFHAYQSGVRRLDKSYGKAYYLHDLHAAAECLYFAGEIEKARRFAQMIIDDPNHLQCCNSVDFLLLFRLLGCKEAVCKIVHHAVSTFPETPSLDWETTMALYLTSLHYPKDLEGELLQLSKAFNFPVDTYLMGVPLLKLYISSAFLSRQSGGGLKAENLRAVQKVIKKDSVLRMLQENPQCSRKNPLNTGFSYFTLEELENAPALINDARLKGFPLPSELVEPKDDD